MKLQTIALAVMITLSGTASANWMDGMSNSADNANGSGTTLALTKANGWGKGDADGEIDFSITLKGKGHTNIDAKMSADGTGNSTANGLTDSTGESTATGATNANVTCSNNTNGVMAAPLTHYVPMSQVPQFTAVTKPVATNK